MKRIASAVLLSLAACGTGMRSGDEPAGERLQLCVQNGTTAYGNIIARAGLVRFDVMPGREVCKPLPTAGPTVRLLAETTGGGSRGPITYATTLQTGNVLCWRWRLTETPTSATDLRPCDSTP